MRQSDVVDAILVPDHDRIPPAPVVGRIGAGVVREVVDSVPDLDDLTVDGRINVLPERRIRGRVLPRIQIEIETVVLVSLVGEAAALPLGTVPELAVLERQVDERIGLCLTCGQRS